jgi:hypothetical protein
VKVPRLRVFAGPNGSGKSTIKADVPPALTRFFVNADELEKEAKATGFIDLSPFGIESTFPELVNFHVSHYLIRQKNLIEPAKNLGCKATESITEAWTSTLILHRSFRTTYVSTCWKGAPGSVLKR